ncbi:HAD hydrolase-like protein [Burkholderia cenocepacia]|uniref:HAD hydrolase-like protein n=1 Tax=Burkholderia cenocepacia TaxID=95486 RepID=UPI00196A55C7|nr:HAD hydrolase-like protein [Burkholderia cenocepacia]MBN3534231.1 HAD hydrolase-like protein [Burkholderia cenocepacia]
MFDLDETLLRTDDIKEIREAGKNNATADYKETVLGALNSRENRHIYGQDLIKKIRHRFPELKIGVFTRSPRSYADTVLAWAYPQITWDIVVAYEDVRHTKPYGEGIDVAMRAFDIEYLSEVMLVGDNDVDVRAAYHCGCIVTLDKGAWPNRREWDHWHALEHVPDAIIDDPIQLLDVLDDYSNFLPELERALEANSRRCIPPRFDKIGHFIPKSIGGDKSAYQISVCGRSFSNYESLKWRKMWHSLTESIEENKDSDVFPGQWVETVRIFLSGTCSLLWGRRKIIVSVVPHRPGRKPRLENFLIQLAESIAKNPLENLDVECVPDLFAYKQGVKSQHGDFLGRDDRFINVRDHLYVQRRDLVTHNGLFLVIDDVVTTGASLIYAHKYLADSGASDVKCLAFAKNVGNISQ